MKSFLFSLVMCSALLIGCGSGDANEATADSTAVKAPEAVVDSTTAVEPTPAPATPGN